MQELYHQSKDSCTGVCARPSTVAWADGACPLPLHAPCKGSLKGSGFPFGGFIQVPLGVHVAAEIYTLMLNERPCIGTPLVGKNAEVYTI